MLEIGDCVSENKEESLYYYMLANETTVGKLSTYKNKDNKVGSEKEEEASSLKSLADKGDVNAMFNYAVLVEKGDGIDANKEEAIASAMNNYANMLYKGECVKANKEEAFKYYKMAINNGNDNAIFNYAVMLEKGCGSHRADKEKAAHFYKLAAYQGDDLLS